MRVAGDTAFLADKDDPVSTNSDDQFGIAKMSGNAGETIDVLFSGTFDDVTKNYPGSGLLWLGNAGQMTQAYPFAGPMIVELGRVISATTIFFHHYYTARTD